jgi:hypothetical protein
VKRTAKTRVATKLAERRGVPGDYVSEADSVGATYRLWRVQRRTDADIGELPTRRQRRLARLVSEGGLDRSQKLGRLDGDALERLTKIDDEATRRGFARALNREDVGASDLSQALRRYDDLDSGGRETYRQYLSDTGPAGVRFVSRLDSTMARRFFDTECRGAAATDPVATTDGCGDLSAAERRQYRQSVVAAADNSDDIDPVAVMEQVGGIGSQTRRDRLKLLIADSGGDGIRLVRRLSPDRQRKLLDIDDRVDPNNAKLESDLDMGEWRLRLATYRSQVGDDVIRRHIDDAKTVTTDDRVEDAEVLFEPVANLRTDGELTPRDFLRPDNELRRTRAYATDPGVGRGDARNVEVEPQFDGTNKDVDLAVTYRDGTTEYVELKRLDGTPTVSQIQENVFKTGAGSSINQKFTEIGDEVPRTEQARVGEISVSYATDGDGVETEQELRALVGDAVDRGRTVGSFDTIAVDRLRVVPRNGEPFTIDLTQYKEQFPRVVPADRAPGADRTVITSVRAGGDA